MSYPISRAGVGGSAAQTDTSTDNPIKSKPRRALGIMQLEPRIMFDGAAPASVDHADSSAPAADSAASSGAQDADQGSSTPPPAAAQTGAASQDNDKTNTPATDATHTEAPATPTAREVIFIDSRVPDLQSLVAGAAPGVEVHVLEADRDGLQQIADYLAENNLTDLSAIQIVSHGGEGAIQLGSITLNNGNLAGHAGALAAIGDALSAEGDILLYGCNVASGQAGLQFLAALSQHTGADVAASTDNTGAAQYGGDWTLESATGEIEAATPFDATESYSHLLTNETFTVNQVTVLTIDVDGDGQFDPGDTVTTTVSINNNSTTTNATGVTFDEFLNGMTLVNQTGEDINVSPLAFDDTYSAIGNTLLEVGNATGQTGPQSSASGSVIANDVEFFGDTFEISAYDATGANGGSIVMITTGVDRGSFTYVSAAGFTGTDTFTYTLVDKGLDGIAGNADDLHGIGFVSIVVTDRVWYVDSAAATNGTGTSTNPFNVIDATTLNGAGGAGDADSANDYIYIKGTPTGPLALENGQHLIGTGSALVVNATTLATAATNSTLSAASGNTLTLASGNEVTGINITNSNSAGTGISGSSFGTATISNVAIDAAGRALALDTGTVAGSGFTSVDSDGGANNVSLVGVNGTVNLGNGALNGASGTAFSISGGNANVDYNGSIAHTGNAAAINMASHTGGTVSFDGTVTSNGSSDGINLTNNTGTTINFTNTLTINTSASGTTGFNATGGGTVTATGSDSTITSGSGTALNVVGTTIGAADLTFRSISSNGGSATGIILDTTGLLGGLHVTGTGTAGSGGTIANKTGADGSFTTGNGIYLNSTADVRLTNMQLNDFQNSAIRGFSVTGFSLEDSVISGTIGTSTGEIEGAIAFGHVGPGFQNGLFGNSLIDNVNISGSIEHHVEVYNQSGTMNLTISNSNIHDNSAAGGADGIQMEFRGTAQAFISIDGNSFSNNKSQAVQISALENSNIHVTISDNIVTRGTQGNEGILLSNGGNADLTAAVTGNTISGFGGTSIFVGQVAGQGTAASLLQATIADNIITAPTSATNHAIIAFMSSALGQVSQARLLIDGNTITQNSTMGVARGILVDAPDAGGYTPEYHATVTNNTVHVTDNVAGVVGIVVQARNGATGRFDVSSNTVDFPNGNPGGVNGVRVRQADTAVAQLARGVSGSSAAATVLDDNHAGATTTEVLGTVSVINNGIVQLPASPTAPTLPLLAAPGGVEAAPPPASDPTDSSQPSDTPATPPGGIAAADDGLLSQAELDAMVEAAMQRWAEAGLTEAQLAALGELNFTVADMTGWYLGSYQPDLITLDVDAAGYGWFIDTTPLDDAEFVNVLAATQLQTDPTGAPAGHYDLLTTVMHEMGHALGLSDSYSLDVRASLMYGYLVMGERRLAGQGEASGAVAGSIRSEEFLASPVVIGTLPANKLVNIQWQATINPQNNQLIVNPVNFGTVTATNVGDIGADNGGQDFVDTNSNTVTTVLDTLSLGSKIWNDVNGNGVDDGEAGIVGVTLTLYADTNDNNEWDAGDVQIATTTTVAGGAYAFTGLAEGDYILRVDAANFTVGALVGFTDTSAGFADPDNNGDGDDNGGPLNLATGVFTQAITLNFNQEPTAGTGNDTNNTLDIGFITNVKPDLASVAAAAAYTENAPGTTLSSTLTVTDGNDANLASATIKINDFVAGDVLSANVGATGIVATYDGAGTLTLTGSFSTAAYQQVLRTVAYSSTSENPTVFGGDTQRTIQWQLNDGQPSNNLSDLETTTVTITAQNDAAVLSSDTRNLTETNLAADISSSGTLTISDVDSAATFTAQPGTAGSYGTFAIDANGAWTYTASSAHNEFVAGTTYTDTFSVTSADGTVTSVTINILGTNDPATLSSDTRNLTETNLTADISSSGTLTISDVDSATTFTAQPGTAGSYGTFAIDANGAWTYTASSAHNEFVAGTTYTDTFSVTSADGTVTSVTINILGTNDAAVLSSDTRNLTETNLAADISSSGTLTISDVDSAATFTAQPGTAGSYGTFAIDANGAWTYTASSAHNEFVAGTTYTDTFSVTSADGTVTSVTINILGTNDAAVITGTTTGTVIEAGGVNNSDLNGGPSATGTLTDSDIDNPPNTFQAVAAGAATSNGYGAYEMTAGGTWTYTLDNSNAAVQALNGAATLTDTFTVQTVDGTTQVITVTIQGDNDAPEITPPNLIAYNANNGGSVLVNPNLDLTDVDSTHMDGATVAITFGQEFGDVLLFVNQAGISGSFNAGTGVLTLTGNAPILAYETALTSIRFASTSDDSGLRIVTWRVNDGTDTSAPQFSLILVRGVDRHHHHGHDGHHDDGDRGNDRNDGYGGYNGLITNVSTNDRWNGNIGSGYFYINADVRRVGLDGSILELQTPVAALGDALGGDAVQTTATLLDGKPLPEWLKFDPQTGIMTGRLPANIVASIQPNIGQATDDEIVTGSIGNGSDGTPSSATHGTISVQITSRDAQGNIATTIFTIDLANKQSWLPNDRDVRRHAALELQRALAGSSVAPTAFMAPALDGIEDALADAGDAAGRAGLSQQLDGHGWRGMHADRMALIASLQQTAAGWR